MNRLFDYFPQQLKESVVESRIARIKQSKPSNPAKSLIIPKDFAFPTVRKLPMETKRNVLSAMTHFFNVKGVGQEDRAVAFKKIIQKAELFGICTIVFEKQYEAYLENVKSNESKNVN